MLFTTQSGISDHAPPRAEFLPQDIPIATQSGRLAPHTDFGRVLGIKVL